ncbi:CAF1-domain-containing protein [Saitoella complicata NRRL Y-17804]|uniref:poly(A)-specific ribonuclease n=1 Tax=Saitoella complicata (strain BCRC 22490 / CBS 7301 / JCM 7358 / NBRC 10748 / NRRL Y-17804) TaxID=698492 RepID=A0A0E9NJV3_SAICN|nr:CAF1-domain-containing protein [Saitoella complicata NRRL Y-17804]ODQ54508.1 CAF1-domain-containing protein [Saitoella complicata NRRL Y-17804]GAO50124.1 hypothetical protein G7K_4259-t1 [Saitoella complicata NRRL Y-17804]
MPIGRRSAGGGRGVRGQDGDPRPQTRGDGEGREIREVWAHNLESEMAYLRDLVERYPYIFMDTEFPGVVARPIGSFKSTSDYHYQTLRCNVDLLKVIQLGVTFANAEGKLANAENGGPCTWQFNFRFDVSEDMCAQDSIDLLTKSGLDWKKHQEMGIDFDLFGELLISSGWVLFDDVKWISFHGGYDFGYLLKLMTCSPLPTEPKDFLSLLQIFFPAAYDIKYLLRTVRPATEKTGLQALADDLQIQRIGSQHQAGSDSLLTAAAYFEARRIFFEGEIDDKKYRGQMFGIGHQTNTNTRSTGFSSQPPDGQQQGGGGMPPFFQPFTPRGQMAELSQRDPIPTPYQGAKNVFQFGGKDFGKVGV